MKILLAVSGGIDSMYMAHRAPELFPGASCFAVAHCNFRLRGQESDDDEAFVRDFCAEAGYTCHVKAFDTSSFASRRGISIEMAARELRYAWFSDLRKEWGYDATAVAHNANDNAETLMLNLLRGTGARGVKGMEKDSGGILRPLLETSREEIRQWMQDRGYLWREDRSNASNEYKRNLIRNEVFPIFRRINPSFVRTLNEDMLRFREVFDIAQDYCSDCRRTEGLLDSEEEPQRIDIKTLKTLPHWKYVLWDLLEGSRLGAEEFRNLCRSLEAGTQMGGRTFGEVRCTAGEIYLHGYHPDEVLRSEILAREQISELKQEEGTLILDADALPDRYTVRVWKEGDWMRPFGMNGRKKKISDLITPLKIHPDKKKSLQVIELEGSHVAALLCYRIDEAVKVTPTSKRILRLTYE